MNGARPGAGRRSHEERSCPRDPGCLLGGNLGRGFPAYVRDFNANFLAMPALPSERLAGACDDRDVVVRVVRAPGHGTYFAVVNTGFGAKAAARIRLPVRGPVRAAVSGAALPAADGVLDLELRPCQLYALHAEE